MSQLLNFPNLDGNKFFVVSEDVEATYAEYLTMAWLQTIRKRNPKQSIIYLLFSYPKNCLDKRLNSLYLNNIDVQDYFSINCETDEIDIFKEITHFAKQHVDSILVINCITTLALQVGSAKALRFVEKLQQNHKAQVFCIYRRDLSRNIPRIEMLSHVFVSLKKSKKNTSETEIHYEASITHRKAGGSVVHSKELICQNVENYSLTSEKIRNNLISILEQKNIPEVQVKPQASFRIEMNEQEMKQRDSVPLPYILSSKPNNNESKIIYVPDDADDLDEEDPDDDLDI